MSQVSNSPFLAPSLITAPEETPLILVDELSLEYKKSPFTKRLPSSMPGTKREEQVKESVDLLCKEYMAIPFKPSLLETGEKGEKSQEEGKEALMMVHELDAGRGGCMNDIQHVNEPLLKEGLYS